MPRWAAAMAGAGGAEVAVAIAGAGAAGVWGDAGQDCSCHRPELQMLNAAVLAADFFRHFTLATGERQLGQPNDALRLVL